MRAGTKPEGVGDRLAGFPPGIRWLMLLGIFAIVILIVYSIEAVFRGTTLKQAQQREQSLKQSVALRTVRYTKLAKTQKQAIVLIKQRDAMLSRFPKESQMHSILKKLTRLGHKAGLSFVRFKPDLEKNHGYYGETPIQITALGNYHQMATFLSDIANSKSLITVHDFKIKREKSDEAVLTLRVMVGVYHQVLKMPELPKNIATPSTPKAEYQIQKKRNPFQHPKDTSKPDVYYPNAVLTDYPISSLKLIGTITQSNRIWAMVITPKGKIVKITVGNRVGNNHAIVTQITGNQVKFKVNSDDQGRSRTLVLTVRGSSK